MPIQTLRPDGNIQPGKWTIVGPAGTTLWGALADDNDATYASCTVLAQLDTEIGKVSLTDISLPAGSKIFSVGMRARVKQVAPSGGGGTNPPNPPPHCIFFWIQEIIYDILTREISKLFHCIFDFPCPRPKPPPTPVDPTPPPDWEDVTLAQYLQQPAGGEWTVDSFNNFIFGFGRDAATDPAYIAGVYVDINFNTAPVVTPTGPTASVTDTTTPTATWLYADQESDPQESWIVRVFSEDQYTDPSFDPETSPAFSESGWQVGQDLSWTIDRDCPNGNWRAYMQVQQQWAGIGNHRSAWAMTQWAQSIPGPPEPHLDGNYEPDQNRIRLDLTEGGPSPATISYNLYYSDNSGISWDYVRGGYQITTGSGGVAEVFDIEAPVDRSRWYQAQAFRQLGSLRVASGFSNIVQVMPQSDDFWFKDMTIPSNSMVVPIKYDDYKLTRDQGLFRPIVAEGTDAYVIPINGPVYGREGTFTIVVTERDPDWWWDQLEGLWRNGNTILYQLPNAEQYYIQFGKDWKISDWLIDKQQVRYRFVDVDYVEVQKPPFTTASFIVVV